MLGSVFKKVAGLQLFGEYWEIPPVAASEKFINYPGKHQWRRRNRFFFLINTTE